MSGAAGQLVVLVGPSGTGKTTIKSRLRKHPRVRVLVTVTTRERREHEVPDRDYHFVDRDTFRAMAEQDRFAETNDVFGTGTLYGSLRSELDGALAEPDAVGLVEVDIVGARNLRKAGYAATFIFIAPPSMDVLEQRLRDRGTESENSLQSRLARARAEMEQAKQDGLHIVVNETVDEAVEQIHRLIGLEEAPCNS